MKTIRITGVPEHFNYPWRKIVATQPFEKEGVRLKWTDESKGSGQMNKYLREDQTDIAIVLTESFLKDFQNGNTSKMIGFHVKSPLIWGVHIHENCRVSRINEIDKPSFLISRMGSGSQLMGFVLAQREGWDSKSLEFKEIGNLDGALEAMTPSKAEMFLWEKYTTKPWVDSKQMKRIGEVASPWPCFVMVATQKALKEFGELIFTLRDMVYKESLKLEDQSSTVKEIAENYELKEEDVQQWSSQTKWETGSEISRKDLTATLSKMKELGIINKMMDLKEFLTLDHITIID